MSNRFYLVPRGGTMREWDVHATPGMDSPQDCHYFGGILARMDCHPEARGLDFVMTWDMDAIPRRGNDVVVLLIGNEWFQLPAYASEVLAVFKTGGLKQFLPENFANGGLQAGGLELLRGLRNQMMQTSRFLKHGLRWRSWERVFPVPLGYFCHVLPAFKPLNERGHDVLCASDRSAAASRLRRMLAKSPKDLSRISMAAAIGTLRGGEPGLKLHVPAERLGFPEYAAAMMNSRICLCPRGNIAETFRHLEAARCGCVIISEALPDLWYNAGFPGIQIRRWSEMPRIVAELCRQPERMEELSAATLDWWREKTSEEAVAAYMANRLSEARQNQAAAAPLRRGEAAA